MKDGGAGGDLKCGPFEHLGEQNVISQLDNKSAARNVGRVVQPDVLMFSRASGPIGSWAPHGESSVASDAGCALFSCFLADRPYSHVLIHGNPCS